MTSSQEFIASYNTPFDPFQITSRLGFSRYIVFAMYLNITYVQIHSKQYTSRKTRTTYERRDRGGSINLRHPALTAPQLVLINRVSPSRRTLHLSHANKTSVLNTNLRRGETKLDLNVARFISKVTGCPLSYFMLHFKCWCVSEFDHFPSYQD